jgi:hypothetical protein
MAIFTSIISFEEHSGVLLQGICGAILAAGEQNPPVHLLAHAVLFREASQMHEAPLGP